MSQTETLHDVLIDQLKDLYSAEIQLLKALPRMEKKAGTPQLKEAFRMHTEETRVHVERLDKISSLLDEKLTGKTCKAMKGLLEEGKEVLEKKSDDDTFSLIDAELIAAAQRVEHYEISAYGTTRAIASALQEEEIIPLLSETLAEECEADKKLTSISEKTVLPEACKAGQQEEDEEEEPQERTTRSPAASSSSKSSRREGTRPTQRMAKLVAILMVGSATFFSGSHVLAESSATEALRNEQVASRYKVDNTGRNARDVNENRKTADSQALMGTDNEVLARIRREIVNNDALSTNAQNVKIMIDQGIVTLRGPVKNVQEKTWIEDATSRVAPNYKVDNQIEVSAS